MGAPANFVWLPLPMLMVIIMAMATLAIPQSNDTASSNDGNNSPSPSPISSTMPSTSTDSDLVVSGDLNKAARVEQMSSDLDSNLEPNVAEGGADSDKDTDTDTMSTPRNTDDQYDVIDVMAANNAGMGKPHSTGQTTRIYTTGEVNDDFWLKHLGDDFKHAIHLQVGETNDDYNRIINQTSDNGVHEEVHHEYLPGAERPPEMQQPQHQHQQQQEQQSVGSGRYGHLNFDGEAMNLKDNYLRQQEQQQRFLPHNEYTQQNTRYNQQQQQQVHTRDSSNNRHSMHNNRYKHLQNRNRNPNQAAGSRQSSSIINSSEDTLHAAQSQATPTSAATPSRSSSTRRDIDIDNPLPFKSAFNDYGSRPTRDLTYLLYKRGL
ncbi:protein kinase 4 [Drosophila innubila]|uniref:protein kinase 4 n=1 Tax=Drosophila innubila TaxID=198719 RepID=UPI00148DACCB|nr:protein kinase 4 [Drosophila innubila]